MARRIRLLSPNMSEIDRFGLLPLLELLAELGCLLILLYSFQFRGSGDVLRIFGVGTLAAGAALMTGFLLGFIFAVPRMGNDKKTDSDPPAQAGSQVPDSSEGLPSRVTPNSNLGEISDWLTKILVGVGLVELKSVPAALGKLSYFLGSGLRPAQCGGSNTCSDVFLSGQAAGLAIVILFFTLGFLFGCVWTLLYFQGDIGRLLGALIKQKRVTDLIFKAEAYMKEKQFDKAIDTIDEAIEKDPKDGRAVMTKARIFNNMAQQQVPFDKGLLNQALALADKATNLLPGKGEPIYNKACYQNLLELNKNDVLATLTSAFALNPALRTIAKEDSDLKSLWEDDDFKKLTDAK
jgi:hypothetical protein